MGKKITTYATFSSIYWKGETNKYLKSIITISTEDIDVITNLAKTAAKKVMKIEENTSALTTNNGDNDDNIILCNGSESSESSIYKDVVDTTPVS
jgi:hypothetical protein